MFKNLKKYKHLKEEYKNLTTSEENSWKVQKLAENSLVDQIQKLKDKLPKYLPGDEKYYIYPDENNEWQVSKGTITLATYNYDFIMRYEIADSNEDLFSWPTLENLIFDDEYEAKDMIKLLTGISNVFEANKKLENPMVTTWTSTYELMRWLPDVC